LVTEVVEEWYKFLKGAFAPLYLFYFNLSSGIETLTTPLKSPSL
jgi:hypothetical protein